MTMRFKLYCFCLCIVMLGTGCSVKEDRALCPCWLYLDFSAVDNCEPLFLLLNGTSGFHYSDTLFWDDSNTVHLMKVPKAMTSVCVFSEGADYISPDGSVQIPVGEQCPQLLMSSALVDLNQDIYTHKIVLSKNYCRMLINVEDSKNFEFRLGVRSNVRGYYVGGLPIIGEFHVAAAKIEDGAYEVFIPRQVDNSMILEVEDESSVLKSFALGEFISKIGYDWQADDLEDILLTINYSRTSICLKVGKWGNEYLFDIVI